MHPLVGSEMPQRLSRPSINGLEFFGVIAEEG
jgi:hypothetical protein